MRSDLELSESDKAKLFWASFLSLTAAGVGFVFRSMVPGLWGQHFQISDAEVGMLFGAGLWPIAIMMILFSLLVDKIGYKASMFFAFVLQAASVVMTYTAGTFNQMWWACILAGLGHGVVEAVINPLCASIYRNEKSKWLNILHAAWPAGLVLGGVVYLSMYQGAESWLTAKTAFWFMLLPVLVYGVLFLSCKKFPIDERVEAKIPMSDMLKEFGGMGAFIAITFIAYEICTQLGQFEGYDRLIACFVIGAVGGAIFGFIVKSQGKWMFFFLCLIMIPLATAEIATDGWIRKLMEPSMGEYAGWALVFSASIMMILRFFAGIPLKFMSPPTLLLVSSVFSIIGLFALSSVSGILVLFAFIFYAVGQTFYWPTVLGFVSEQFPKGGAMTLNTVSAMGLLTVGVFGFPFLGAVQDHYNAKTVIAERSDLNEKYGSDKYFFGVAYKAVDQSKMYNDSEFMYVKADVEKAKGTIIEAKKEVVDEAIKKAEEGHAEALKAAEAAAKDAKEALAKEDNEANKKANDEAVKALAEAKKPFVAKVSTEFIETKDMVDGELKKAIIASQEAKTHLNAKLGETGQSSLKVAAILPIIMAIAFIMIIFYYKAIGGYKPVILADENSDMIEKPESISEKKEEVNA